MASKKKTAKIANRGIGSNNKQELNLAETYVIVQQADARRPRYGRVPGTEGFSLERAQMLGTRGHEDTPHWALLSAEDFDLISGEREPLTPQQAVNLAARIKAERAAADDAA